MKWSLGLKENGHTVAEQLFDPNSLEVPIRKAWDIDHLEGYDEEGWPYSLGPWAGVETGIQGFSLTPTGVGVDNEKSFGILFAVETLPDSQVETALGSRFHRGRLD